MTTSHATRLATECKALHARVERLEAELMARELPTYSVDGALVHANMVLADRVALLESTLRDIATRADQEVKATWPRVSPAIVEVIALVDGAKIPPT